MKLPEEYHITFKIKDASGNVHDINQPYEQPQSISGNGIKDSNYVAVGFGFSAQF